MKFKLNDHESAPYVRVKVALDDDGDIVTRVLDAWPEDENGALLFYLSARGTLHLTHFGDDSADVLRKLGLIMTNDGYIEVRK